MLTVVLLASLSAAPWGCALQHQPTRMDERAVEQDDGQGDGGRGSGGDTDGNTGGSADTATGGAGAERGPDTADAATDAGPDTAVADTQPDPVCSLAFDPGPCFGNVPVYYFDVATDQCQQATYGGCEGNDNRFDTLDACRQRCAPELN